MGAVSAAGLGASALWQAMRDARSGIRPLLSPDPGAQLRMKVAALVPDYDAAQHFEAPRLAVLDRVAQFALLAAREAVRDSGLRFNRDGNGTRTAVVIGTGTGGELSRDEQSRRIYRENAERAHPMTIVRSMPSASASQVSMEFGLTGPAFAVASACASSNHALAQAALLIRHGLADSALAGGTEACISFGGIRAWEAMRVVADDTCRPFCKQRRGLVLGEGAAMLVLEERERAAARGVHIHAEIAGYGLATDGVHLTRPSVEGQAAAMRLALADARMAPGDIGYVNAHGTGTQANDAVETAAIKRVLGAHAARVPVSSTKSMHGHLLGAAGALEMAAAILALGRGMVPPTRNLRAPDPECDLDYVAEGARAVPLGAVMSNSFAFGGTNAVLIARAA
jgi:nodulation protein E